MVFVADRFKFLKHIDVRYHWSFLYQTFMNDASSDTYSNVDRFQSELKGSML